MPKPLKGFSREDLQRFARKIFGFSGEKHYIDNAEDLKNAQAILMGGQQYGVPFEIVSSSSAPATSPGPIQLASQEEADDYIKKLGYAAIAPKDVRYAGDDITFVPAEIETPTVNSEFNKLYDAWINRGVKAKFKPIKKAK